MDLSHLKSTFSLKQKFNVDVLWNLGSLAVLAIAGIVINTVIAARGGSESLGVFNQVYAVYIVLSQVSVGGFHFSALQSISQNQDDRELCSDIATSAAVLSVVVSGLVCVFAFAVRGVVADLLESPGVFVGLGLAIPGLLFFSLNKVLLNVLNGMRSMRAYAIFQALRFLLILISIIVMLLLGRPGEELALSLTTSELVLFVLLLGYINLRVARLRVTARTNAWYRKHLSFGGRGFFSGFLSGLNTRVDVVMLGYFSGDAMVGVNSFAAIMAEGFAQITLVCLLYTSPSPRD